MKLDNFSMILGLLAITFIVGILSGAWISENVSDLKQLRSIVKHEIPDRIAKYKKTGDPDILKIHIADSGVVITAREDGTGVIRIKEVKER